jgi:hypothetical protein
METKYRNQLLNLIYFTLFAVVTCITIVIASPYFAPQKHYSDINVETSFIIDSTNYFTVSNQIDLSSKAYGYHEIVSFDRLGKKMVYRSVCPQESDVCTINTDIPEGVYVVDSWQSKSVEISCSSQSPTHINVKLDGAQIFLQLLITVVADIIAILILASIASALIPKKKEEQPEKT